MSASYRIKLSSRMRPYVGRVVRNGWVQKAFAAQIGRPTGACVRNAVHRGMSQSQMHQIARDCARIHTGTKLHRGDHGYIKGRYVGETGSAF